jgi:hypothetical protein
MTDPTGRSFLSYRRVRSAEAALLITAQHNHGIPTWQDVSNLGSVPTEDEIRRVLADMTTASAVLFVTPEVEQSAIIRNVEVPKIVQRAEASDGFFVVPLAAGGLGYADAAEITSNHLSAQNLTDWNLQKISSEEISADDADQVAHRVLVQRIQAIHRYLSPAVPLRIGLYVRGQPPFEPGVALALDWASHFSNKETTQASWNITLLPALRRIADAMRQQAPGRGIEAFGVPTLPAAIALGSAFSSTSGLRATWRQFTPGQPEQTWSLEAEREPTGFAARFVSKDPNARDVAVLISVADNTEPLFAMYQKALSLRALVHIEKPGSYPHRIATPGQAVDIALVVQDGIRTARRQYGNVGTVHLFMAVPAGLAMLVGQLLNTFGAIQTYEHISTDGSGAYRPAALLWPSS